MTPPLTWTTDKPTEAGFYRVDLTPLQMGEFESQFFRVYRGVMVEDRGRMVMRSEGARAYYYLDDLLPRLRRWCRIPEPQEPQEAKMTESEKEREAHYEAQLEGRI